MIDIHIKMPMFLPSMIRGWPQAHTLAAPKINP